MLLVPLLLCCLLCGLGVFGVVFAADRHVTSQRAYAREALASTTANAIAGQLEIATFAVMSLSTYLTQEPECSTLDRKYEALASRILSWVRGRAGRGCWRTHHILLRASELAQALARHSATLGIPCMVPVLPQHAASLKLCRGAAPATPAPLLRPAVCHTPLLES